MALQLLARSELDFQLRSSLGFRPSDLEPFFIPGRPQMWPSWGFVSGAAKSMPREPAAAAASGKGHRKSTPIKREATRVPIPSAIARNWQRRCQLPARLPDQTPKRSNRRNSPASNPAGRSSFGWRETPANPARLRLATSAIRNKTRLRLDDSPSTATDIGARVEPQRAAALNNDTLQGYGPLLVPGLKHSLGKILLPCREDLR